MAVTTPAAYHGPGWSERAGTQRDDIGAGWPWATFAVHCDADPLTDVVLHCPPAAALRAAPPDRLQHLAPISEDALRRDLAGLAIAYAGLGITTHWLPPLDAPQSRLAGANAMYARDLFWMTPEGAVLSRMASTVRTGEERQAATLLAGLGAPTVRTVGGAGLFEGADALWLRPDLVAIGVGRRTNAIGAAQVAAEARRLGARTLDLAVPVGVQHLLGVVQVIGRNLLAVRTERLDAAAVRALRDEGLDIVEIPEWSEVTDECAMNLVTVADRAVVLIEQAVQTRRRLESHGVNCAAVVAVPELLKGAGGIGCATGILARRPS